MKPITRQSRDQLRFDGKFTGMQAKDYYGLQKIDAPRAFKNSAKYLDAGLWKKFDRFKPITDAQSAQVHHAINRALMDGTMAYPYTTPTVMLHHAVTKKGGKKIWGIDAIRILTVKPVSTDEGNVYLCQARHKLAIDGKVGHIGYSAHAVERLLERVPEIVEYAFHVNALVALRILTRIADNQHVFAHRNTWMLEAKFENCHLGYFPIVYNEEHKLWIGRTFLLHGMEGTPAEFGTPISSETLLRVCPELSKNEWG